jgi:hypothetical protein
MQRYGIYSLYWVFNNRFFRSELIGADRRHGHKIKSLLRPPWAHLAAAYFQNFGTFPMTAPRESTSLADREEDIANAKYG